MEEMEGYESSDSGVYDFVDAAYPFKTPLKPPAERYLEGGGPSRAPGPVLTAATSGPRPVSPVGDVRDVSTTSDDSEYYMGRGERGIALIFNHENFDDRSAVPRRGTGIDKTALIQAFTNLSFEVRCYDDLRYDEIRSVLEQVSNEDHSNRDCIAVAVLSHGFKNDVVSARDHTYHMSKLVDPLTPTHCPSLKGKPKLFFIQADRSGEGGFIGSGFTGEINSYSDVLISHSTFEGCHSFRNVQTGGWYVQTLCSQLEAHGRTTDLVSLLTDVGRIVNEQFRANNPGMLNLHGLTQQPCFTSSLKRGLWLR